jgi:hypothetical protein
MKMKNFLKIRYLVSICVVLFCMSSAWGEDEFLECKGVKDTSTEPFVITMVYVKNLGMPMGLWGPKSVHLQYSRPVDGAEVFWNVIVTSMANNNAAEVKGWTPEPELLLDGKIRASQANTKSLGRWQMSTDAEDLKGVTQWMLQDRDSANGPVIATRKILNNLRPKLENNVNIAGVYQCTIVQAAKPGCCSVS